MPMAINALNVCQGPADLYVGVFGTAEPLDSAATVAGGPPGAGWVGVGGTEIGVTFEEDDTYEDIKVNQLPLAVGGRLTAQVMTVKTQLKEATLANLANVLNQLLTTSVQANYTTVEPISSTSSTQPNYSALIFDTWAPTLATGLPARRRIIVRKVLSKPKLMIDSEMAKSQLYDVTWQAYYVSSGVKPWHWIDQTA